MPEVISSGPILSGSGSGGSGASGSGSLNGGGGSSCRTNEWTVNPSLAAQQQSQSGLTGNAGINNREVVFILTLHPTTEYVFLICTDLSE